MGLPAEKMRRATYADLEAVPANKVAELVRGTLYVTPRPAARHARASSALGVELLPRTYRTGFGDIRWAASLP